jgi:hypothetical protein
MGDSEDAPELPNARAGNQMVHTNNRVRSTTGSGAPASNQQANQGDDGVKINDGYSVLELLSLGRALAWSVRVAPSPQTRIGRPTSQGSPLGVPLPDSEYIPILGYYWSRSILACGLLVTL